MKGAAAFVAAPAARSLLHADTPGPGVEWYVTTKGAVSRWGWAQNSLVTVDKETKTYAYTREYYLMKHLSAFVRPGARRVEAASWTGYENQLAFVNPDGSTVVAIQNDAAEPMAVRIAVGGAVVTPTLPADSFSTLVVERG